jgi:hypothetical protein
MTGASVSSSDSGEIAGRKGFLTSASNVTALVSIFVVVIFAVVTQLLYSSGAISLSTTLQLTMWLVALGFVVLLAIAYMFFRVVEIAMWSREDSAGYTEALAPAPVLPADANGQQDTGTPRNPTDGPHHFILGWSPDGSALEAEDAWVRPDELRHPSGSEYSVSTEEVFPDGCYLVPDSITLVSDEPTGQQVYECRVVDADPERKGRPRETVVKILADQKPSQASIPRFGWVEFEHLTITPYVTDQNPMRIRYSLRATGLHPVMDPLKAVVNEAILPLTEMLRRPVVSNVEGSLRLSAGTESADRLELKVAVDTGPSAWRDAARDATARAFRLTGGEDRQIAPFEITVDAPGLQVGQAQTSFDLSTSEGKHEWSFLVPNDRTDEMPIWVTLHSSGRYVQAIKWPPEHEVVVA